MYVDGGGYYDPDVQLPDEARHLVPEGIDLIYWDYYHQEEAFYHTYIGWHKKLGHLPVFGGGICTWTGAMVQNYNHTVKATEAAMRACKAEGVQEAFACIWNDNGGECMYLSVLPGLVRYAEHMYHAAPDAAHMAERIRMFTGLEETAWASLCRLDCLDASLAPLEPQNPRNICCGRIRCSACLTGMRSRSLWRSTTRPCAASWRRAAAGRCRRAAAACLN